jgi:putative transposase
MEQANGSPGEKDRDQKQKSSQEGGAVPTDRQAGNGAGVAHKKLSNYDSNELRKLVNSGHPVLGVSRQYALLALLQSTHFYRPTPVQELTLGVMARIHAHYLEDPCSDIHQMMDYMARESMPISRDRVRKPRRCMASRSILQKPGTMATGNPCERFPRIVDLNQASRIDLHRPETSPHPATEGSLYLSATIDLFSRHLLGRKSSNSLDTEF